MADQQAFVKLNNTEIDDEDIDEEGDRASYLYMELESTTSFKDIDIDKMLEHTTLDDFMRGLYTGKETSTVSVIQEKNANVLKALMTGRGLEEMNKALDVKATLKFGHEDDTKSHNDLLKQKAL